MLLESVLSELRIDLDDEMIAMPSANTSVVPQMGSPDDPKPNQKQGQLLYNKVRQERHSSSVHNSYREPGKVPFRWEIEPGVPKPEVESPQRESVPPLRLPPSAYGATISLSSPKRSGRWRTGGYLPWNFSGGNRGSIHRHVFSEEQLQLGDNVPSDDMSSSSELDSSENCSPVSILERRGSPAISLSSLDDHGTASQFKLSPISNLSSGFVDMDEYPTLSRNLSAFMIRQNRELMALNHSRKGDDGVFPCSSKCFFIPSLKNKEKAKQSVWSKKSPQRKSFPSSPSNSDYNILLDAHRAFRIPSAMRKQSRNSGEAVMKQVRFSVQDANKSSPSNKDSAPSSNPATVAANELEWASYGLF